MKKIAIFFSILIILIVLTLFYSRYIGTKGLNVKEYKISYNNLSNDFYGLKIVHLSDIHYGRTITKKELKKIVKKINITKPDIVVLTGDIFTNDITLNDKDIDDITKCLGDIDATIGKFAITGDNDNLEKWESIINNSGFKNINNTYELIYTKGTDYILLAGMSSNKTDKTSIEEKLKSTIDYINGTESKPNYSILLMHEPDYIDKFDYSAFNLILAGHSLNGQFRVPVVGPLLKVEDAKKYYDEHYKLKSTDLYISSGLGTYKYSFRLFNRPSFNLYRLTN